MITIVLADDHPFVRQNLQRLLEAEDDFQVIGEAADGHQAVQLVQELKPNILVSDLVMPHLDGLAVARHVRDQYPQTQVILITIQPSPLLLEKALDAGVAGFIHKDQASRLLAKTIRSAQKSPPPRITPITPPRPTPASEDHLEHTLTSWEMLTRREKAQLKQLASNSDSWDSDSLLDRHAQLLLIKLGLSDKTQLIEFLSDNNPE